jgi:glucose-6-phosphate 1-dehydrogenase
MPNSKPSFVPTILIILGITGDLAAKKILPAIFNLYLKGQLPGQFRLVGFGRRNWQDQDLRNYVETILSSRTQQPQALQDFLKLLSYHTGEFTDAASYKTLSERLSKLDTDWTVCSNKLFYLSVPPVLYENILRHLESSGLTEPCGGEEGWTRVLVEKPFGKDQATAEQLDKLLGELFEEEQIYRIDHYLAKEMVQNILTFRFSNDLFEKAWDNKFIEKIDIRLWETLGVEKRGSFYDGLGALRDVGQNHLLQMLALVLMDHPGSLSTQNIRAARAKLLSTLDIPSRQEAAHATFRSQYQGYQSIEGVRQNSQTETYFKATLFSHHPRWENTPLVIESGKRMAERRKEIVVTFKHVTPCLCPPGEHLQNRIIFSVEPEEGVFIDFWVKKPGLTYELERRELNFLLRPSEARLQYVEEYEKLIVDSIVGDQTLFVSTEEVKSMWKVVDPIVQAWEENLVPLSSYVPDTGQAAQEAEAKQASPHADSASDKTIGLVGLGKMGGSLAQRLMDRGWNVVGYNRTWEVTEKLLPVGLKGSLSIEDLAKSLPQPKVIWLMLTAGKPVDDLLFGPQGLVNFLQPEDIIIDGGNSYYEDSARRFGELKKLGIHFIDVGVSGGPSGARNGPSLMIGGSKEVFQGLEYLFRDIALPNGYKFFEGAGAGHFVKMVHNGIEYGMMQAIAEGFDLMKTSGYKLDLTSVADIYNHGSVIESRLIDWLKKAFAMHGENLDGVSGSVAHTGEGEWTVKTARELKVQAKVIEEALNFRIQSQKNPSFAGKVLSALREQFGGHKVN